MTDMDSLDLELLETAVLPSDEPETTPEPPRRRRGRPPKNRDAASPDAHSTDASDSPRKSRQPRSTSNAAIARAFNERIESIEAMLTGGFGLAGGGIVTVGMICTGTTMSVRSQQGAQAVISAARVNPTLMRILVRMTDANAWTPLAAFAGALMVAALVDVRMVDVHGFVPRSIIPEIVAMVEQAEAQQQTQQTPQPPEPNGSVPSMPFEDAHARAAGMTDA